MKNPSSIDELCYSAVASTSAASPGKLSCLLLGFFIGFWGCVLLAGMLSMSDDEDRQGKPQVHQGMRK